MNFGPEWETTYVFCDGCMQDHMAYYDVAEQVTRCAYCGNEMDLLPSLVIDMWDELDDDERPLYGLDEPPEAAQG